MLAGVIEPRDRVEVWTVRQDAPGVAERMLSYESLLTPEEHARAARFFHAADRERFVFGRALAWTMLARFGQRPPNDWSIVIDEHGRPELGARTAGTPDLRFNLSHTTGLIACALTVGREVGVDVERIDRKLTYEIPERFFSAREVADLRALPRSEQDVVFFDYWTLKESYIKARGLGLALPLGQFTFVRARNGSPTIEFAPELHDDPRSWQFAQFWPTRSHRMAVAVRRSGADLPVTVSDVVPL
jgi:4'-phosphopantetheinyl transferase